MSSGVHFYSKPSQNFHRAHDELLRQDNQQQLHHSQSTKTKQANFSQTSSTRRYPDHSSAGRVVRPPTQHLLRTPTPQGYNPQTGRVMSNTSYHPNRFYEENMNTYPRIMQYQQGPDFLQRTAFPYPDYIESDQLLWTSPTAYASQYPRPYNFNQTNTVLGSSETIILPDETQSRGFGRESTFNLYDSTTSSEFLRSSNPQNQKAYPPMSTEDVYPLAYPPKEMFPQEYYEVGANQFEFSSIQSQRSYSMSADSGLNIEASSFHPANSKPGHVMSNPDGSENPDPYHLASIPRHGSQSIHDNSRGSYVTSETERPLNLDINERSTDDNPGPDVISVLIDRSLSLDTEHHEIIAETDTHEY